VDLTGKEVGQWLANGAVLDVETVGFAPGLYFLKVESAGKSHSHKILIAGK
jgi:hypothetical protein